VAGSFIVILMQALGRRPNTEPMSDAVSSQASPPVSRMQITYALPVALATWVVLAWLMISHHESLLGNAGRGMTENKINQNGVSEVKTSAWQNSVQAEVAVLQINNAW